MANFLLSIPLENYLGWGIPFAICICFSLYCLVQDAGNDFAAILIGILGAIPALNIVVIVIVVFVWVLTNTADLIRTFIRKK